MQTKPKPKPCASCGEKFVPKYRTTERACSPKCEKTFRESRQTPKPAPKSKIKPVSDKKKKETAIYLKKRIEFLERPENKICFIQGCGKPATTIEHRRGRIGSNYLDETTWAGCCHFHNIELERNHELSRQYQLSKLHTGGKGDLK